MVKDLKAGVYVITAKAAVKANSNDDEDDYGPLATQWFIVTDLGLTTLSGHDGVHAIVRSLSTAEAVPGVKLRLVAVNNDILGEAVSDADGHVRFDPGLARGTGGHDAADRRSRGPTPATMPSSTCRTRPSTCPTAASTAVRRRRRSTSSSRPSAASTARARRCT